MGRRAHLLILAVALLALLPAPARAAAPHGFFGISPQGPLSDEDFELIADARVATIRLPLFWYQVERSDPAYREPDWSDFDRDVARAARHGIRVLPVVWGSPDWIYLQPRAEPAGSPWARWQWARFLRRAVQRYGPQGDFWEEHPEVPFMPIRSWEIWNEENIVTFSSRPNPRRFARLLRISGRVLHRLDPGSKVILGGLFGRPLQIPPNVSSAGFLERLYRAGRVKRYFDAVALHPYVARAAAIRGQIRKLRRVMRRHHDRRTPILVTELGWGSDSGESRWEKGFYGQATEMGRAFRMLTRNRVRWRIGRVYWFSWRDQPSSCVFCDSAGLLTANREAKPAWFLFNRWTGGDWGVLPRAQAP